MNLLEYQVKSRLADYGIFIPASRLVYSLDEVKAAVRELGDFVTIKPHTPENTTAHPVNGLQEAITLTSQLFRSMTIRSVLIEQTIAVHSRLYITLQVDRPSGRLSLTCNLHRTDAPPNEHNQRINALLGLQHYQARDLASTLDLPYPLWKPFAQLAQNLVSCFMASDADLLKLTPIAITHNQSFVVLNAQMRVDTNALYRQKTLIETTMQDSTRSTLTTQAREVNITYVPLEGSISCISNGAGLGMAIVDMIAQYSHGQRKAANFIDLGGGNRASKIDSALRIALQQPAVKGILLNVFGGITRCDEIARELVNAYEGIPPHCPIIVRLAGNRAQEGQTIIQQANIPKVHTTTDLTQAIQDAIAMSE
ncbi:MAG: hypothetical protein ACOYL5_01045 [Phototrophicaceae bacterium]|jgi:succinyl-CoA synthetase beta subunit